MELLSILASGAVIGGALWVTLAPTAWLQCGVGFIRAARRQPIDDRLKAYCQRR